MELCGPCTVSWLSYKPAVCTFTGDRRHVDSICVKGCGESSWEQEDEGRCCRKCPQAPGWVDRPQDKSVTYTLNRLRLVCPAGGHQGLPTSWPRKSLGWGDISRGGSGPGLGLPVAPKPDSRP